MRMSRIVRTAADIIYPFIVIFGLYVVAHGHLTPGGGFQGGAVIATGGALVIVAYSYEEVREWLSGKVLMGQEVIGLVGFIGVALLAFAFGQVFFFNYLNASGSLFGTPVPYGINTGDLNTGGFVPLMNFAVGCEVWGGLTLVILYMLSAFSTEKEVS
ncbi:MAG: sodium:proton antiporter [Methanoregula sp.]|nr:sodium:proton antiporter [Methanoregula sp.]